MVTSAPSAFRAACLPARAVVTTRAPSAVASWIANVPMPLPPPCTSTVSPSLSLPKSTRLDQTVHATSGRPAASTRSTPRGTGSTWPAGATTRSAYPPPASRAQTSSPAATPVTSGPTSVTTPEHSRPGYGEAPGGGGYRPARWNRSGRLTPLACTWMRTSSAPGCGSGTSDHASTSGPPGRVMVTAYMGPVCRSGREGWWRGRASVAPRGDRLPRAEHGDQAGHQDPELRAGVVPQFGGDVHAVEFGLQPPGRRQRDRVQGEREVVEADADHRYAEHPPTHAGRGRRGPQAEADPGDHAEHELGEDEAAAQPGAGQAVHVHGGEPTHIQPHPSEGTPTRVRRAARSAPASARRARARGGSRRSAPGRLEPEHPEGSPSG